VNKSKYHTTLGILGISTLVTFAGCFAPDRDPLAAARAAEQLQSAAADAQQEFPGDADAQFEEVRQAVLTLTPSELASAVNLGSDFNLIDGLNTQISISQARRLQSLLRQLDPETFDQVEALGINIDQSSDQEILDALIAVGVEDVTLDDVRLLREVGRSFLF
jgi:hypothetical protein